MSKKEKSGPLREIVKEVAEIAKSKGNEEGGIKKAVGNPIIRKHRQKQLEVVFKKDEGGGGGRGKMNLSIGLTINDTLLQTKYYLIEDDKVSRIKGGV